MTATQLGLIVADFQTALSAAVSASATSATIQSATDSDSVSLAAGKYVFTVDGNNSSKEYFLATLSGTSLSSIQSISRQGALSSGFARAHRTGATVTVTDHATLRALCDIVRGNGTLDSTSPIKYDASFTPTNGNYEVATWDYIKAYADGLAIAGAPDASTSTKGIAKLSYAPASATNPIAVGDNDPRVPSQDENNALVGTSGTAPSSTNKFIDAVALTGMVMGYAGSSAPTGWLLCDGSAVSRTTYATLFALISTTYGSGDGSTTFNVPNLKGKVIVGLDSAQTEFDTLGETGGAKTHTLTESEMPAHSHDLVGHTTAGTGAGFAYYSNNAPVYGTITDAVESSGSGAAHNNLQPYLVLNYIIKH